ncbi:hypothetical protein ACFVW2_20770 [Streptomyces sp. NPDC058171]
MANSKAVLEGIQHEVIGLTDDQVAGGGAIYQSFVQAERNRVVVRASRVTPQLRSSLARKDGAERDRDPADGRRRRAAARVRRPHQ